MVGQTEQPFQPDAVLPSQFFATRRRQALSKSGEYRLLIAVLEDAIARFQKYVHTGHRSFAEAAQWIMGTEEGAVCSRDEVSGFSFEYICGVLDFDAASVRRGLQRWREAQLRERGERSR